MNKQEVISKLKSAIPKNNIDDYQRGEAAGLNFALLLLAELDESEKPVVPQFIADYIDSEQKSCSTLSEAIDNMDDKQKILDWFYINYETFAKAWLYGYEIEKEKLYRAKNKQTGEYLCYCFEFFHDKNNSSENQRFTAEEKRWKELGYWDNDLYAFEEVEE